MTTISVNASKKYDIKIKCGLLKNCGNEISKVANGKNCVLISDNNVNALYGEQVTSSLKAAGFKVYNFNLRAGEKSKNAQTYIELLEFLAIKQLSRNDIVVALGGGVVGDIAGFAAATYMRGIDFVQIPTTLLAMVDSSIGGKTAINLEAGKNLAGAFHQPSLVLVDTDVLSTLSATLFADGCAEVIKYAVLSDPEILTLMQDMHSNIEEIIKRCLKVKKSYVEKDEREDGMRVMLNLGHSIGHAFEVLSGYKVSHGRAVSTGLAVIARAACAHGECSKECVEEIVNALINAKLPTEIDYTPQQLVKAMKMDKKREGNSIKLIIPREIGRCEIRETPYSELAQYIASGC